MTDNNKPDAKTEAKQLMRSLVDAIKSDVKAGTAPTEFAAKARLLVVDADPLVLVTAFGMAVVAVAIAELEAE